MGLSEQSGMLHPTVALPILQMAGTPPPLSEVTKLIKSPITCGFKVYSSTHNILSQLVTASPLGTVANVNAFNTLGRNKTYVIIYMYGARGKTLSSMEPGGRHYDLWSQGVDIIIYGARGKTLSSMHGARRKTLLSMEPGGRYYHLWSQGADIIIIITNTAVL